MLLRHVGKHVREQNWVAVGIDFAIVVFGVFFGLQVTSWNDSRIADSRAETYYQRLAADLRTELDSREARIQYYEQTRRHAVAAIRAMQSSVPPDSTEFLVDLYQATQRWVYAPQRTTYDELIASGIADAIPDVDIRTQLANLYVGLDASSITQQEPTPFRDELRRHLHHEVQSAIRERCNDQYAFRADGLLYLALPATCDVQIDDGLASEAIAALGAYPDLEKDLARHIAILDSKLNSFRAFEAPIQKMIERLDRR